MRVPVRQLIEALKQRNNEQNWKNEMSEIATINAGILDLVGGSFTQEDAAKVQTALAAGYGGKKTNYYKWKDGANHLRILPRLKGEDTPIHVVHRHWINNWGDSGKAFIFNCPKRANGGRCPACEKASQLFEKAKQTGNEADKELAKQFLPSERGVARVIDRKDEAAGVQLIDLPKSVLDELMELRNNEDVYGEDYTDIMDGSDLLITRKKQGGKTSYTVSIPKSSQPRLHESDDQILQWLTDSPDVSFRTTVKTYEQIIDDGKKLKERALAAKGAEAPKQIVEASGDNFSSGQVSESIGSQEGIDATTPY